MKLAYYIICVCVERGEVENRKKLKKKKIYVCTYKKKKNKKTNKKLRKRIRYVCIVFFWATNFSLMSSDPCMTNKKNYDNWYYNLYSRYIYICNIIKYNCITIITFIGILNSWILYLSRKRGYYYCRVKKMLIQFEVAKENPNIVFSNLWNKVGLNV